MTRIARTAGLCLLLGSAMVQGAHAQTARAQTAPVTPFPVAPALQCLEGANPGFVTTAGRAADGSPRFVRYRPSSGRVLCETVGGRMVRRPLTADDQVPNGEDPALSINRRCPAATPVRDQAQRIIAYFATVRC